MLTNEILKFLDELSKNNNKEWFENNRKRYEKVQTEIKSFIATWIEEYSKIDESIAHLDPKKCTFRINRDVRFSTNKTPYKNNLGAYLAKGGKGSNYAGFYLHLEPNNCFFGAGNYQPIPEDLAKIRQEIDYNFSDFKKVLSNKKLTANFDKLSQENKLKRPPKGYDENNEAIEYLKLKGFTVFKKLKDNEITSKDFVKNITELSTSVKPFIDFLNNAIE